MSCMPLVQPPRGFTPFWPGNLMGVTCMQHTARGRDRGRGSTIELCCTRPMAWSMEALMSPDEVTHLTQAARPLSPPTLPPGPHPQTTLSAGDCCPGMLVKALCFAGAHVLTAFKTTAFLHVYVGRNLVSMPSTKLLFVLYCSFQKAAVCLTL